MIDIKLHGISVCFGLFLAFGVLLHAGSYRFAALLFQKSLSVRREVLALPNRITSKIGAPLFGAKAKLGPLHRVAAMGLPVPLLAMCLFRLPRQCTSAARSLRQLFPAPRLPK